MSHSLSNYYAGLVYWLVHNKLVHYPYLVYHRIPQRADENKDRQSRTKNKQLLLLMYSHYLSLRPSLLLVVLVVGLMMLPKQQQQKVEKVHRTMVMLSGTRVEKTVLDG